MDRPQACFLCLHRENSILKAHPSCWLLVVFSQQPSFTHGPIGGDPPIHILLSLLMALTLFLQYNLTPDTHMNHTYMHHMHMHTKVLQLPLCITSRSCMPLPAFLGDSTLRLHQAALILVLLLKRAQVHIPCCWVSPLLLNTPGSSHSFLFLKYRYRLHCREQSKPQGSDTG